MTKYNYHIFPPYIDAYRSEWDNPVTLDEVKSYMESHAGSWGEASIGKALLLNKDISVNGKQVVCCAYLYDQDETRSILLALAEPSEEWYDNIEFVEVPSLPDPDMDRT